MSAVCAAIRAGKILLPLRPETYQKSEELVNTIISVAGDATILLLETAR